MLKISEKHQAILKKYAKSYPVYIENLSKELGVPIYSAKLPEGVSGVIKKNEDGDGRFFIAVDEDEPTTRQIFTAAHELGHYLLHRDQIGDGIEDNYLFRSEGMSNQIEIEANEFAADLLMPKEQIVKAMDEGYDTVEKLAKAFRVSITAMSIRIGLPT
ncbi:MAG: ImmA/IrrE family metallo-endopeptidase [Candidatus Puniceispirillales bacterium WSBS_2018_MAG_OTU23]